MVAASTHKLPNDIALASLERTRGDAIVGGLRGPETEAFLVSGGKHGVGRPHRLRRRNPLLRVQFGGIERRGRSAAGRAAGCGIDVNAVVNKYAQFEILKRKLRGCGLRQRDL